MVQGRSHDCMRRLSALALIVIVVATNVWTQSKAVSTEELTKRAEVVAVGKVNNVASEWNETKSMIRTRVTLAVDQYLKGPASANTLTLYVPGGEVNGVGEMYSHMATFKKDENVLVFAEKDSQGRYRVSAGNEGKLNITRDEGTGKALVGGVRSLEEVTASIQKYVKSQNQK